MILLWSPQNLVSQMFVGLADGTRKTVEAASFLLLCVLTETLVAISADPGTFMRARKGATTMSFFFFTSVLVCLFRFVPVIAWNTVLMFAKYL